MKNQELIHKAIQVCETNAPKAKELLLQFLNANTVQKALKFDIFKYVAKDFLRPSLCGALHSEGFLIATDAHILIRAKADYNSEFEGKIVGADGAVIDGNYPVWQSLVNTDRDYSIVSIDMENILSEIKKAEVKLKAEGEKKDIYVRIYDTYFTAKYIKLLASFMKGRDMIVWLHKDNLKPIVVKNDIGEIGLLMPRMYDANSHDDIVING